MHRIRTNPATDHRSATAAVLQPHDRADLTAPLLGTHAGLGVAGKATGLPADPIDWATPDRRTAAGQGRNYCTHDRQMETQHGRGVNCSRCKGHDGGETDQNGKSLYLMTLLLFALVGAAYFGYI